VPRAATGGRSQTALIASAAIAGASVQVKAPPKATSSQTRVPAVSAAARQSG